MLSLSVRAHLFTTSSAIKISCPAEGWVGGKQYNITVSLNAPVRTTAESTVLPWPDDDDIDVKPIEISAEED